MRFILTTHADRNPLVAALRAQGVIVRSVRWPDDVIDLDGCIAFYGNLFGEIKSWIRFPRLLKELRYKNIPYVFWNRDAPWDTGMKYHNQWLMRRIKPVDIYLAHSLQDCEKYGGESHYFPNAAQKDYFESTDLELLRYESAYEYDVCFFGSLGGRDRNAQNRNLFLNELKILLNKRRPELRINFIDTVKKPLAINEQLEMIRRSKINLNVGAMCDLPGNKTWGLPERVYGIPAAGGFPLTDFRKSLKNSFNGIHYPSFKNLEDCFVQINMNLDSFKEMRQTAEVIYNYVIQEHTYRNRAQQFMDILESRLR